MKKIGKSNLNKRAFSWEVKAADIQFMSAGQNDSARDAAAGCGNCSAISRAVLPKQIPASQTGKTK